MREELLKLEKSADEVTAELAKISNSIREAAFSGVGFQDENFRNAKVAALQEEWKEKKAELEKIEAEMILKKEELHAFTRGERSAKTFGF